MGHDVPPDETSPESLDEYRGRVLADAGSPGCKSLAPCGSSPRICETRCRVTPTTGATASALVLADDGRREGGRWAYGRTVDAFTELGKSWSQRMTEAGIILDYTPELSAQGMSTRAIAPTVGAGVMTVSDDRKALRAAGVRTPYTSEPESLDEYRIHGELGDSSGELDDLVVGLGVGQYLAGGGPGAESSAPAARSDGRGCHSLQRRERWRGCSSPSRRACWTWGCARRADRGREPVERDAMTSR